MPVIYSAATKTARMNASRTACANGDIQIMTTADAVLATHGLDATAGSVTGSAWTIALDDATVAATAVGTAARARIRNSSGVVQVSGLTVGVATGVPATEPDITVDNTSIAAGQNVSFTAPLTITHAPDPV